MILDALLTFTGTGNGGSGGIASGQWTDLPSTGTQDCTTIIDLGVALGVPTSANGGGARDMGIGDYPALKLSIIATVAFTTGATTQFELQGAPDNGSGAPGAYTTMWEQVTAVTSAPQGWQFANVDLPRTIFEQVLPRYLQLVVISGGTTNTTGLVEAQIVIDRDDQIIGTSGALSGYPAGVTVAN